MTSAQAMIEAAKNKELFMLYIEEIWNKGNLDLADEMFTSDYIARRESHPETERMAVGPEVIKQYVSLFRTAFPDLYVEIHGLVAENDMVAGRGVVRGTFVAPLFGIPPTGKKATWTLTGFDRFVDGKIAEGWGDMDMVGALQDLGVMPAPQQHDGYEMTA